MAKLHSAKCPSCGAALPVALGVPQVTCRYCNTVITVENRKMPEELARLLAMGQLQRSTTLYLDPNVAREAGQKMLIVLGLTIGLPFLVALLVGVGPWACTSIKNTIRPFPATCESNETVTLSGNWEGNGAVFTSVGYNCKIHVKNAKLKATTFIEGGGVNNEITLENVTLETTETAFNAGANTRIKIVGGSVTSRSNAVEADSNLVLTLENTTLESKTGSAVHGKYNLKIDATNSKIIGKKSAIDTDANPTLTLKKNSEISSDGIAIKATSTLHLEADGGKISSSESAIAAGPSSRLTAQNLTVSGREKAMSLGSSTNVEFTGGSITSQTESAIETDGIGEYTFSGTTLQGAASAIAAKNGLTLKAIKKARLVGTNGNGVQSGSNSEITLNDASIEGGRVGVKGESNLKVRLGANGRIVGKKGGIAGDSNVDIDATSPIVEGGAGAGIECGYNAKIAIHQGSIKGTPALAMARKPSIFDLDGVRIEGEQRVPAR